MVHNTAMFVLFEGKLKSIFLSFSGTTEFLVLNVYTANLSKRIDVVMAECMYP